MKIPIHNIETSYNINITPISYNNGYDFNAIHKHNYFEILFFEKGGGHQLIDFNNIPIKDNSCYIVKPKQVHLVKRFIEADGLLIQFTNEMLFTNTFSLLKSYSKSSVVYEENQNQTKDFFILLKRILDIQKSKSTYFKEKSIHLLSTLLYSLEENINNQNTRANTITEKVTGFTELVDEFITKKSINEYAELLNISSKKLTQIVKKELNTTPLKHIHDVLILNIKRDLAFKELSYKEIAYNYNFDSPSNFSLFVKKQTGLTPSELQKKLLPQ